jgi:hypothetical protein
VSLGRCIVRGKTLIQNNKCLSIIAGIHILTSSPPCIHAHARSAPMGLPCFQTPITIPSPLIFGCKDYSSGHAQLPVLRSFGPLRVCYVGLLDTVTQFSRGRTYAPEIPATTLHYPASCIPRGIFHSHADAVNALVDTTLSSAFSGQ